MSTCILRNVSFLFVYIFDTPVADNESGSRVGKENDNIIKDEEQ